MRELILFRHAKSDQNAEGIADRDRPLATRGRKAAPQMAKHLLSLDILPDHVLCSNAKRTRQTCDLMLQLWRQSLPKRDITVTFEPLIYEAPPMAIMACFGKINDRVRRLMIIGHNPGLEELALYLLQGQSGQQIDRLKEKFPTAAAALIALETNSWAELVGVNATLVHFSRPNDLENE